MESVGAGAGPQAATRTLKSNHTQGLKCPLSFITLLQTAHAIGLHTESIAVTDAVSAVRRMTEAMKTLDPKTIALWFTANTIELDPELIFP